MFLYRGKQYNNGKGGDAMEYLQLIMPFVCPVVLLMIGLYSKNHSQTERGKSRLLIPVALRTARGQDYAQIIGPDWTVQMGVLAVVLTLIVVALGIEFRVDAEKLVLIGNAIGVVCSVDVVMILDNEVEAFLHRARHVE